MPLRRVTLCFPKKVDRIFRNHAVSRKRRAEVRGAPHCRVIHRRRNHMDTKLPSPNASSPKMSGILSAVLSVGVVVWAAGAIAGTAFAQVSPTAFRPTTSEIVKYADLDVSSAARRRGPAEAHRPRRQTHLRSGAERQAAAACSRRRARPLREGNSRHRGRPHGLCDGRGHAHRDQHVRCPLSLSTPGG